MPLQPDLRRYWVPIAGFLWGACMTLAGVITRIMDFTNMLMSVSMRPFVVLALPGFLLSAIWLLGRLGKQFPH